MFPKWKLAVLLLSLWTVACVFVISGRLLRRHAPPMEGIGTRYRMQNGKTYINMQSPRTVDHSTIKPKTILLYNSALWMQDWVGKSRWETSNVFNSCPVSNCVLSKNKTLFHSSDVVVIRLFGIQKCIKKTKTDQVWVFVEQESPTNLHPLGSHMKHCYKNMFNWTFTYRRDSDFTLVHGYFKADQGQSDPSALQRDIKSKTRNAVGFMSHCLKHRTRFVSKLNATGLDIDIYGDCGKLKCRDFNRDKAAWNTTGVKSQCFDVLNTRYKFYLSFENSLCVDYTTEKSLNLVMRRNIIPVIRDGANHTLYHPPGSYIHTNQFADVQNLTSYLLNVGNNRTKYRSYFNWRKHYKVYGIVDVLQENFCEMCKRSHNLEKYHRLYDDVEKFVWSYAGKRACWVPKTSDSMTL